MRRDDEPQKKSILKRTVLPVAVFLLGSFGAGALIGLIGVKTGLLSDVAKEQSAGELFTTFLLYILLIIAAMPVQIIIHEGGHLVFGLLNGFRFLSFRVGPLMLLKKDGRYSLKKFSIAGTGGQCIMVPPDKDKGTAPFVRYLCGGCIFNMISAVVFFLCALFLFQNTESNLLRMACLFLAFVGAFYALLNGIPMKSKTVPNDGYTVLSIRRDPCVLRHLWTDLKVNATMHTEEIRPKDMPSEWFEIPDDTDMKNVLAATSLVLAESRAMDAHDFAAAKKLLDRIEDPDCGVAGIHRTLLRLDRLFINILENGADTDLSVLEDSELKTVMRAMKHYPSVIRTEYAVAKGVKKDEAAASACLAHFESVTKTYPNPADIATERDLMALIK